MKGFSKNVLCLLETQQKCKDKYIYFYDILLENVLFCKLETNIVNDLIKLYLKESGENQLFKFKLFINFKGKTFL